jgi:hypothetical protein
MKIGGPGAKPPADPTGAPDEVAGAAGTSPAGKAFAEKTDRGAAPQAALETGRASESGPAAGYGAALVADISADLTAGRITPQVAIERVVERIVDRQVGADAPASVREAVGAALRQALEDDPMLAEKLRALEG